MSFQATSKLLEDIPLSVRKSGKRTIRPNPRYLNPILVTAVKHNTPKTPESTTHDDVAPIEVANATVPLFTNGNVSARKGQRCTMSEFRAALMKQKNKELLLQIDCDEMAEDSSIDMNEFVSTP